MVQGGQFPVNPLTIYYARERLTAEGLPPPGPIEPLTILDLDELEGCQALQQRRGTTLPQLLDAWRRSQYGDVAFRNYLAYEYGGQEIRRPQDVQASLKESFNIIQQLLGVDPREGWVPTTHAAPVLRIASMSSGGKSAMRRRRERETL